ncbi:MAG: RDD family protein [Campylobacteraceae bacterium]|jgi:uncharacterized RDD family membrane protein YckC|nr:RDD family protein [Campylobacteraceae bacterium]
MTERELIKKFESKNITLASFGKRFIAYTIDDFIVAALICIAFSDFVFAANSFKESLWIFVEYLSPYIVAVKIIYHTFFVCLYGATIGKMVVKIRVICIYNGETPDFYMSLIRATVRVISEAFLFVGFIWAFVNNKRQTWQDIIAKTLVVDA